MKKLFWCILVLFAVSCTPAIVGVTVAAMGATAAVTYEVKECECDAGPCEHPQSLRTP